MAEIRVERKEGRGIWPWIIGLLVAVLVLWFLFGRDDEPRSASAIESNTSAPAAMFEQFASRPAA